LRREAATSRLSNVGRVDLSGLRKAVRLAARAAPARARCVVHIAAFEIGRQVRQPLFWLASALFFAFALTLMTMHGVLGSPVTPRNAPPELSKAVVILSIFYLAVIVAMAGDAALRDARSGFEPILRAAPVRRVEHLLGRWIGVQVAANLAFLVGISGLVVGVFAPWIDKAAVGPFNGFQSLLVWLVVAVPTVTALTSLCFALAAALRTITGVYVTVILLWVLALQAVDLSQQLHGWSFTAVSLIEPFGLVSLRADFGDLDPAARAVMGVRPGGYLVANRLVWAALSAALVGLAFLFERFDDLARLRRSPASTTPTAAPMACQRSVARFPACLSSPSGLYGLALLLTPPSRREPARPCPTVARPTQSPPSGRLGRLRTNLYRPLEVAAALRPVRTAPGFWQPPPIEPTLPRRQPEGFHNTLRTTPW